MLPLSRRPTVRRWTLFVSIVLMINHTRIISCCCFSYFLCLLGRRMSCVRRLPFALLRSSLRRSSRYRRQVLHSSFTIGHRDEVRLMKGLLTHHRNIRDEWILIEVIHENFSETAIQITTHWSLNCRCVRTRCDGFLITILSSYVFGFFLRRAFNSRIHRLAFWTLPHQYPWVSVVLD